MSMCAITLTGSFTAAASVLPPPAETDVPSIQPPPPAGILLGIGKDRVGAVTTSTDIGVDVGGFVVAGAGDSSAVLPSIDENVDAPLVVGSDSGAGVAGSGSGVNVGAALGV